MRVVGTSATLGVRGGASGSRERGAARGDADRVGAAPLGRRARAPVARYTRSPAPAGATRRAARPSSVVPVLAVPSPRRAALPRPALLLVALAACTGREDPVGDSAPPRISLSVQVLDAGDTVPLLGFPYAAPPQPAVRVAPAGGLVVAYGQLSPGRARGRARRVTDGRLLANGAAIDGRILSGAREIQYAGELGTPRADGVLTLELPRLDGQEPVTLRLQGVARAPGEGATIAGDELRLRVVPPPARPEPPRLSSRWTVALTRGGRTTRVEGTTPLAAELVLPVGAILPGSGAVTARLTHAFIVSSTMLRPSPTDTSYQYDLFVDQSLRFAPVVP